MNVETMSRARLVRELPLAAVSMDGAGVRRYQATLSVPGLGDVTVKLYDRPTGYVEPWARFLALVAMAPGDGLSMVLGCAIEAARPDAIAAAARIIDAKAVAAEAR